MCCYMSKSLKVDNKKSSKENCKNRKRANIGQIKKLKILNYEFKNILYFMVQKQTLYLDLQIPRNHLCMSNNNIRLYFYDIIR